MAAPETFVIVGGGLAAAEAAKTLRAGGFGGRLVVVTEEDRLPYERPPLTKAYLRGEVGDDKLLPNDAAFYEEHQVEVAQGNPAVGLDAVLRRLTLRDGATLPYDRLLIATGATAVRPDLPGIERPSVHLVRTAADSTRLREAAAGAKTAVVAGGGWIAAETAASLRQLGLEVTLVVPRDEVLERHLGSAVGRVFSDLHEAHGVRLVRRAHVTAVSGDGLRLENGTEVRGELVVLGFGAEPATGLAKAAGLRVDHGIAVDDQLETGASGIWAAGDVASAWHPRYRRRIRTEHWDTARRQGRTAARNMLGAEEVYDRLPFFFSDQYELGMELVGMPQGAEEVALRRERGGVVALWAANGRVVAGMHADLWDAKKPIDRIVAEGAPFDRGRFERDGLAAFLAATPAS